MNEKIINKTNAEHYLWGNSCDSWVLLDTPNLSVKQESMPSGTQEKLHFHDTAQQFFYVLKGSATLYVDEKKNLLLEQMGILIHCKTKHFIRNDANCQLDFLVVSQPSTNNDRNIII